MERLLLCADFSFSLFSFFFLAGIGASVTWNFGVGWWSEVLGVIR